MRPPSSYEEHFGEADRRRDRQHIEDRRTDPRHIDVAPSAGPYEPGETLAVFQRSETERLRLARKTFEGRPFYDLRVEWRRDDGSWLPSKKGTSIKLREIEALAVAMTKAAAGLRERER